MTAQIEIKLGRMRNTNVDRCARRYVARFARLLLLVRTEQSRVMSLLHHNERDARPIVGLQLNASLANGRQFVLQNVRKLSLRHAVTVQNDAMRLVAAGGFVEHDEQLAHHAAQLLDDLLPVLLHANGGRVARRMRVHGADDGGDGRLLVVAGRRMRDVGAQKDDRLVEDLGSDGWDENRIDAAEFDVDLQTQVG